MQDLQNDREIEIVKLEDLVPSNLPIKCNYCGKTHYIGNMCIFNICWFCDIRCVMLSKLKLK